MTQRASLLERYTEAETRVADLTADQQKAEQDLAPVRERRARDQQKLDDGSVTDAKALRGLQSELVSLDRRIADLEDAELEIMDALESAQKSFAELRAERIELENEIRALMARRDELFGEIDTDLQQQTAAREQLAGGVPVELLALYDKVAAKNVSGAARVDEGRCTGCRIDLDPASAQRVASASDDEIVRCEECSRILVR